MPAAFLLVLAVGGCVAIVPPLFEQVKQPRQGRVMNNRVAVVYSKHYQISLGGLERMHAFDIRKYAKIYLQLNTDGLLTPQDVFVPEPLTKEQALLVHTPEYLASLRSSRAVAGYLEAPAVTLVPAGLVDAGILSPFRHAAGGTLLAGRLAAKWGIAVNLAGGYNHAQPDRGGGFCVYADVPIAIRALQKEGLIRRATIVDLDVHQGDGQAVCFAGDESVFTFSMHEGDIYPPVKATSDRDVALPAGVDDQEYLATLANHLPGVLEESDPDMVFFIAGCDVLEGDPLAGLRLSVEGVVQRDAEVIDACARRDLPVVVVLGGGYSARAWEAQYRSVRRTLEKYGGAGGGKGAPRPATWLEKWYTR